MLEYEQIREVESSVEAALIGVGHLRDEPTRGNVEAIVGNLYRALHEVQAINVDPLLLDSNVAFERDARG